MSFTQQLAARNIGMAGVNIGNLLSLESAAYDAHEESVVAIDELHEAAAAVDLPIGEMQQMSELDHNIDSLISATVDAYGADGIDERGAELMHMSVESLLRASKLNLPAAAIVPSFEKGSTRSEYTTEAEEKKEGVLRRIFQWLAKAFASMTASVMQFISKLRTTTGTVEKYVQAVKARAAKATGAVKTGKIKVGATGAWLLDTQGHPTDPVTAITGARHDYLSFIHGAESELGDVARLTLPGASDAQIKMWLNNLDKALGEKYSTGLLRLDNVRFLPGKRFKVSHTAPVGTGAKNQFGEHSKLNTPLIKAEASVVDEKPSTTTTEVDYLTVTQIHQGLDIALDMVQKVKKIESVVDKYVDNAKTASKYLSNLDHHFATDLGVNQQLGAEGVTAVRNGVRSHLAANAIYAKVYTLTLPLALTCIRSITTLFDHNISALTKAQVKTIEENHTLRLGHDKSEAGKSHHDEFSHVEV